jgi:hypothetical protein
LATRRSPDFTLAPEPRWRYVTCKVVGGAELGKVIVGSWLKPPFTVGSATVDADTTDGMTSAPDAIAIKAATTSEEKIRRMR